MPTMEIILDGDNAWPDLADKSRRGEVTNAMGDGTMISVAALDHGMTSGLPSVTFRVDLPDGKVVLFETSMALLISAADAFVARFGHPRDWRP